MIDTKLEGTLIKTKEGLSTYRDYLDSYLDVFNLKAFEYICTPLKDLRGKEVRTSNNNKLTLVDAFVNYLVVGKLHDISRQYYNISNPGKPFPNKLIDVLKENGYKPERLISTLSRLFIESYMSRLLFKINLGDTLVKITKYYATETYKLPTSQIGGLKN